MIIVFQALHLLQHQRAFVRPVKDVRQLKATPEE
jgi:hypothetical protein